MPGFGFPPPPLPQQRFSYSAHPPGQKGGRLANLTEVLQPILDSKSVRWNSSAISVAVTSAEGVVAVASGYADWAARINATSATLFPMGSVQKMYTAAAVMQLFERGVIALNDTISQHVDPYLQRTNGTTLLSLFGPTVLNVTVYHLLSMRSGMNDFDDASTRAFQLARPSYDITPFDILHICQKDFACYPGECGRYSSTGYVLLGFLLLNHAGNAWDASQTPAYEASVVPSRGDFSATSWAIHGTLASYSSAEHPVAHGYQPDSSEWPWPFGGDVYNVSATAGWTCGNLIATTADCARFARALYGPDHSVVSPESVAAMTRLAPLGPGSWTYGMGTMTLPGSTASSPYYGHGGATYGFYSYVGYNVAHDFSVAVATNLELDEYSMYRNLNDIHSSVYAVVAQAFDDFRDVVVI
jgi:CubicO group peptidase (beta-lactamase class C family)